MAERVQGPAFYFPSIEKKYGRGASGTLVRFLLQAGLLDELRLLVHPIVAGAGRHLFEDGHGQVPLVLVESRAHSNGVVALHYSRAA